MKDALLWIAGGGLLLFALSKRSGAQASSPDSWAVSESQTAYRPNVSTPSGPAVALPDGSINAPNFSPISGGVAYVPPPVLKTTTTVPALSPAASTSIVPATLSPPTATRATASVLPSVAPQLGGVTDIITSPVGRAAINNIANAYGDNFAGKVVEYAITAKNAGDMLNSLKNVQTSSSGTGHYDAVRGGFVGNDGRFWQTKNAAFVPQGYTVA